MKFIDLFAGLGGFHNALVQFGHECVFASEIDSKLRELYKRNFNIDIYGDIRKISEKKIPKHDILCAGFPCQPFSHAGKQEGLKDKENGNLFREIVRILKYHKPTYIILENVANLINHDNGYTWEKIKKSLQDIGYYIDKELLSPHDFGIPHNRKRIFIVGKYKSDLSYFNWPEKTNTKSSLIDYLDNSKNVNILPNREIEVINVWQEFLDKFPKNEKLPSFPIWTTEFGATYPFEEKTVFNLSNKELENYKGSFGIRLKGLSYEEKINNLPRYSLFGWEKGVKEYPKWKKHFIRKNREFYKKYKEILDPVVEKLKDYPLSFQKFEWNCQNSKRDIFENLIQFRASGIRIKNTSTSPALISSTSSQIPVIGKEKRYLTIHEASKLQGMGNLDISYGFNQKSSAFKALGNAVNSEIVKMIVERLIK